MKLSRKTKTTKTVEGTTRRKKNEKWNKIQQRNCTKMGMGVGVGFISTTFFYGVW